jgi:transcriptional regulator GlxA family with amidase domain
MKTHLDTIYNWPELAERAGYDANQLAARCGVCVRQLQRFFQRTKAQSPQFWLNVQRLQRAKQLVGEGRSVKEIAFNLKYKHRSHFSCAYKRFYGVAPSRLARYS